MLNQNFQNSPMISAFQGMGQRRQPNMINGLQMTPMSPALMAGKAPMGAPLLGGMQPGMGQTGGGLQMGNTAATDPAGFTGNRPSSGMGSPIDNSPMIQAFLQMLMMKGMGPQQARGF